MSTPNAVARRRRSQRGASVFIVLLVITLLTAVGIFAARNATLVDQAAGFDRQLVQTQYLTELAGRSVTAEIGNGAGKSYLDKVVLGNDSCWTNTNLSPLTAGAAIPCYKLYMSEIDGQVSALSGNNIIDQQTAVAAGSLGPALGAGDLSTASEGVFVVEMTDPFESVPNPGSEVSNPTANAFRDVQLTLTAFAQIRNVDPLASGNPWCASQSSSTAASVSALRAHVTLKNVPR